MTVLETSNSKSTDEAYRLKKPKAKIRSVRRLHMQRSWLTTYKYYKKTQNVEGINSGKERIHRRLVARNLDREQVEVELLKINLAIAC